MRTWEKIWWGFVFSVLGIFLVGIWLKKEDKIRIDIIKNGVKENVKILL